MGLRDPRLGPIRTWDRQNLTTWLCELHNVVNADLKKPLHDCDAFMLDMEYLKDCGDCEVKKDTAGEDVLSLGGVISGAPGGLPYYGGPWSASQYARDPLFLGTVKTQSETMNADDLDALLWSAKGAMEPSEYKDTVAQVAKDMGSDLTPSGLSAREAGRSKWIERLEERFSGADGGREDDARQKVKELEEENDRLRALLAKYEADNLKQEL